MSRKIAIVTGASSGMGEEFVAQIMQHTQSLDEIWMIARRKEKMLSFCKDHTLVPVRVFAMDLCKESELDRFRKILQDERPKVRIFVQSAGFGKTGAFEKMTDSDIYKMTQLNVTALTMLTKYVLPYMTRPGHIIQMASASAFAPQSNFAVYAATKAYVLHFSRALHAEWKQKGITVTAVCPGPVDTEFLAIANDGHAPSFLKQLTMVPKEPVVRKALLDAKKGKAVSVYGAAMHTVRIAVKLFPKSWFI